jgi:hypothetical protein
MIYREKRAQIMDYLERRYEKDPSIVHRNIAGEAILVPIRRNVADMESIYTLDEVGAFIWELIDGQRTAGDIKVAILNEYDVAPEVAEADLAEFLQQLQAIGAVKAV